MVSQEIFLVLRIGYMSWYLITMVSQYEEISPVFKNRVYELVPYNHGISRDISGVKNRVYELVPYNHGISRDISRVFSIGYMSWYLITMVSQYEEISPVFKNRVYELVPYNHGISV